MNQHNRCPLFTRTSKIVTAAFALCCFALSARESNVFFDDFNYTQDLTAGVPAGGIWDGVNNPAAGGANATIHAGELTLHGDGVGWENNGDSGPMLFRNVNVNDLISVTAKVSMQTVGNWSLGGVIVRVPAPLADGPAIPENWYAAWSFLPAPA